MREHRVPMLGTALRRRVDPARSSDPRVRQLVGALATLEIAPAPRAEFRAELRAQLVAVTPRLVEEGEPQSATSTEGTAKPTPETAPRKSGFRLAKPLIAAACVLTAFVLLLGGAVLLSQKALPGDALYGLKRASENTEYGLTGGTVAKGKLKLEFAGRRIGEVGALLPRAAALAAGTGSMADSGQINAETSKLVRQTLGSADADVRSAAQLLGGAAVRGNSASPLRAMSTWASGQVAAMNKIVARIPAGSLHQRALSTRNLIVAAQARAATLATDLGCSCLSSSGTDQLGPIPCATGCGPAAPRSPTAPTPGSSTTPGGGSTTTRGPGATPSGGATTTPGPAQSTTHPGGTPGGGSSSVTSPTGTSRQPQPPTSTPKLPGLPTLTGHPSVSFPHRPHPSTSPKVPISVTRSCVVIVGVTICI